MCGKMIIIGHSIKTEPSSLYKMVDRINFYDFMTSLHNILCAILSIYISSSMNFFAMKLLSLSLSQ